MDLPAEIQKELDLARAALAQGNEGKARVCCRRAAGAAIRRWLARRPPDWGPTAVTRLRTLASLGGVPGPVRDAAARLSTTVAQDHTLPFDDSPLDDAWIIIRHFAG